MTAPGSEDIVVIEKAGEAHVITVNCPDRSGLVCDVCRIILDFGLYIKRGDVTTDGVWCYIVLWVVPHYNSQILRSLLLDLLCAQSDVSLYRINTCLLVDVLLPRPERTLTRCYSSTN